jgi:hypothetical protein
MASGKTADTAGAQEELAQIKANLKPGGLSGTERAGCVRSARDDLE